MAEYRVISIGAMAAHPLWNERGQVRADHATTTLVTAGDMHLIIDPSLPPQTLATRLHERSGLRIDEITHVFLTSFEPFRRRALPAFEGATWWVSPREREAAETAINSALEEAGDAGDRSLVDALESERDLLARIQPAPDALAPGVDLFPLPGVTAGTCAVLLALPSHTVLVCGDAVPTWEHLSQGTVMARCADLEVAQESLREAIEIADALILGRDNLALNPLRRMA